MVKSKKKSLSNAVNERKSKKEFNPFASAKSMDPKPCNPFEVHVNKEKFKILGRKCKHDKGLPGVSRLKAAQKRKLTLAQEYINVHKSNQFKDRRIGKHLTGDKPSEEIIQARYAADRILKIKTNKHTKFNLDDGDILTHAGQSLDMIEQFHNASSEEDEDLDAEFTEKIQFNEHSTDSDRMNGKTAIDELIAKQKQRKLEIAKEKDIVHDLTEKLDTNYKNLLDSIQILTKNDDISKPKMDDYDLALREMIFEPRSAVTNRLKTEAELNAEKANHIKAMEEECLKRMLSNEEDSNMNCIKHRSADDLDEGYFQKDNDNENEDGLIYNSSGKLNSNDDNDSQNQIDNEKEAIDDEENDNETEEESENESESENASENESETENTSSSEDDTNDLSDLKDIVSDNKQSPNTLNNISKLNQKSILQNKKSLKERLLQGREHLPLIKNIPVDYEDFVKLLSTHTTSGQVNIVENLITLCQQEKTITNTEDVMIQLFAFLLQLIDERFAKSTINNLQENFQFLSLITPILYDFMHFHPFHMSNLLRNIIVEKYTEYKSNIKQYPNLEVLIVFKLISNLCSTSDFVHPLATPCYIFMNSILTNAEVYNCQDIAKSLFIITLSLEYARLSKRFLPSVFNSIYNLLSLSINDKTKLSNIPYSPVIKTGPSSKLLVMNIEKQIPAGKKDLTDYRLSYKDLLNDIKSTSINFKLRAFNQCLHLLDEAVTMIADHTGAKLLIASILKLFHYIPITKYPPGVKDNFDKVKTSLHALSERNLIKLVAAKKKPKALRLLEPRIETVYDDKRRPNLPPARKEKVKLLHKIKREKKSAMREIRRDTEFVQKMRLKQQLQSDMERHQKVKRIYQEASMQQGELNALERLKKKKSF